MAGQDVDRVELIWQAQAHTPDCVGDVTRPPTNAATNLADVGLAGRPSSGNNVPRRILTRQLW
jgi:hypothetical protein